MATLMQENGADLRWIQAMLGHRSVESTQVSIRALQEVHESTHPAEQREPDETADLPDRQ